MFWDDKITARITTSNRTYLPYLETGSHRNKTGCFQKKTERDVTIRCDAISAPTNRTAMVDIKVMVTHILHFYNPITGFRIILGNPTQK